MDRINNIQVKSFEPIAFPKEVMDKAKITDEACKTVLRGRSDIQNVINRKDSRKIVIVGPCSIHDCDLALEYAEKLNELRKKVEDKMVIIMRTYFEKPRTTVGWKGFIYDPHLDDSYGLAEGVYLSRKILVEINNIGLPTATEVLGPIVIQYYSDLICWSAIGARTTESQTHRELASGLSMPVGFKNGTEGNVDIALNAIVSARAEHSFLGMDEEGHISVVNTKGNPYGHLILRGGKSGPNYSREDVQKIVGACEKIGLPANLIIDCSHANSGKDHTQQARVWNDVWSQIKEGNDDILGLMIESNLKAGSQPIAGGFGHLESGVSVTDACIGFDETEKIILDIYNND